MTQYIAKLQVRLYQKKSSIEEKVDQAFGRPPHRGTFIPHIVHYYDHNGNPIKKSDPDRYLTLYEATLTARDLRLLQVSLSTLAQALKAIDHPSVDPRHITVSVTEVIEQEPLSSYL